MFTCIIQYEVEPTKHEEFKEYAVVWIRLIEKYGGKHHGYFRPPSADEETLLPDSSFSFPGLGRSGPPNKGFALFSFDNKSEYELYKEEVSKDEDCIIATSKFNHSKCFTSYERSFTIPIFN